MSAYCETLESGWQSLASIVGSDIEDLKKYFLNLGKAKCREDLTEAFGAAFSMKPIEKICWFHLTRVRLDECFSEGLLPSSDSIERIWMNIFYCLENTPHCEVLYDMKRSGEGLYEYRSKLRDIKCDTAGHNDNGPYGFVIPPVKSKFFKYPEITQWICKDYCEYTGEDITSYIVKGLAPKIVKFWTVASFNHQDRYFRPLATVFYHLYNNLFSASDPSDGYNYCYKGDGSPVPKNQIIKVYVAPPGVCFSEKNNSNACLSPLVDFGKKIEK